MDQDKKLRDCFSLFATGVMIASTNYAEKNFGMTINSFASISLNPPLLLFAINNKSSNLNIFKKSKTFSLNILSGDQIDLAKEFAKPNNENKWLVEEYFHILH